MSTNTFVSKGKVSPRRNASEVKVAFGVINNSTAVTTIATPTTGTKIRVLNAIIDSHATTKQDTRIYYGTDTSPETNTPAKIILHAFTGKDNPLTQIQFNDGAGTVGAVNEVVSAKLDSAIGQDVDFSIYYREE